MEYPCGWCGQASWVFRCFTCDPRSEKKLCTDCSMLWHSRGFARGHQLTNRSGLTRSYLAWGCPGEMMSNGDRRSNGNTQVEPKPAAQRHGTTGSGDSGSAIGTADGNSVEKPAESDVQEAQDKAEAAGGSREDAVAPEVTEQGEKKDELMEEEFEFEVVGESVDSGEDGDTASVEKKNDAEDEAKELEVAESAVEDVTSVPDAMASSKEQHSEANGVQETKEKPSAPAATELELTADSQLPPVSTEPLATTAGTVQVSRPAPDSASLTTTTTTTMSQGQASSAIQGDTSNFTPQSRTEQTSTTSRKEAPQPKPVALEKQLRWFPTSDNVLMDMLAARIEAALVIEDALICARIGKCEEPTCRSILLHYEHCKRNEMCGDPRCSEISIVYTHRRACLKNDATPTNDGKQYVCPFCIRIRQRRSLGVVAALDHLIYDQRRALQNAHSEASRNFCLQSINTWTQRKQLLRAETDRLNQLASESSAPIFNFPRYRWHFSDAVSIKREPIPLETNTSSELSGDECFKESANKIPAGKSSASDGDNGNTSTPDNKDPQKSLDTQEDSMPGNVNFNADFINELLRAKTERSGERELAQQEFDGVMELGYAIVDASFCAPSKAQRCLLNCTSILVHLQHHLDLQVCKQPMCTAVEHHFAHLSQCKAREENELCEYCLRVEERQLVRSVDFMEAQQPEAEAKVQKIINDITASFTNHRPDEREQEVIQLEDELEQAEDNKRELTDKLTAARNNLRKVRRNLEHRGISQTFGSHRLPVHFIKVRRGDGSSGNNSKKRRLLGSPN